MAEIYLFGGRAKTPDTALRTLASQQGDEDLDGSYGRFAIKALRLAGLFAAMDDKDSRRGTIELRHWYRGQQITERWRASLHRLIAQVQVGTEVSREAKVEQLIERVLRTHGDSSARDIRYRTGLPSGLIVSTLEALMKSQLVQEVKTPRTVKYHWWDITEDEVTN